MGASNDQALIKKISLAPMSARCKLSANRGPQLQLST